MTQKITVKQITTAEGVKDEKTWKRWDVETTEGSKLGTFDPAVANLLPGTVLDAEIELSGKYTKLKRFKLVSQPTATTTPEADTPVRDEKQASIKEMCAVKAVTDLVIAGNIQAGHPLHVRLMKWLAEALPDSSEADFDKLCRGETITAQGTPAPKPASLPPSSPVVAREAPAKSLPTPQPFDSAQGKAVTGLVEPTTAQAFNVWMSRLGLKWNDVKDLLPVYGAATEPENLPNTIAIVKSKFPDRFPKQEGK